MYRTAMEESQVRTKKRVSDHGEVLTGQREVNAMLDLVGQEAERIDSRFLEPACGDGNFLSVILERKLAIVVRRYGKSQLDFERYAVLAVSSVYGIDILLDNVEECRRRLFYSFETHYERLFSAKGRNECREAVRFILERNIAWGDALTLTTVGEKPSYIIFSEWSLVSHTALKRRDFRFQALLEHEGTRELPLFSDLNERVFVPTPESDYAPVHFLEIARVGQ
jgi:hypothetical protein